jgi:hypothetical protein
MGIISSSDTYCVLASTIPTEKVKIETRAKKMTDLKFLILMVLISILRRIMASRYNSRMEEKADEPSLHHKDKTAVNSV